MREYGLLEMFRKVIRNNELALHYPLDYGMGTCEATAVHVPVSFLNGIDLLCYRFDMFFSIWGYVLNSRVESEIGSVRQGLW